MASTGHGSGALVLNDHDRLMHDPFARRRRPPSGDGSTHNMPTDVAADVTALTGQDTPEADEESDPGGAPAGQ